MKNLLKIIAQKILGKNQNNLLDLCIIGLGNPGDKYNQTRHNAGYDYLDLICKKLNIELKKSNKIDGVLGETVYGSLSEIDHPVDIIDVFRPSNEAVEIANEAIKIKAKVLWLQLNIKSYEAKKIAEANNIIYIEDKCTKIEVEKYIN